MKLEIYSVELFELSLIRLAGKAGKWQEQDRYGNGQGLHQVLTHMWAHMIVDDIIIPVSTKIEKKMKIFFFAEIFFAAVSDPNEQLLKNFFSYWFFPWKNFFSKKFRKFEVQRGMSRWYLEKEFRYAIFFPINFSYGPKFSRILEVSSSIKKLRSIHNRNALSKIMYRINRYLKRIASLIYLEKITSTYLIIKRKKNNRKQLNK